MGIGDELMMAGEARRRAAGTARRFLMLDKDGEERWHFIWEGNPHVARPGEPHDGTIGYVNRRRCYVADETREKRTFLEYRPAPAELRIPPHLKRLAELAAGAVVFNPAVKHRASPNKDWGINRWRALLEQSTGVRWIQLGEPGVRRLYGCEYVPTAGFWEACAVLSGARAAVVHEGALHHAAAALGVPAVVIYGGYISPRVTGYAGQKALYVEDEKHPLGCGMRVPCAHCAAAMEQITPQRVLAALGDLLAERKAA